MSTTTESKGFMRLLLRGALGGALGGFVWATVAVLVSTGFRQGWWYWLTLGFLYQGLPLGMIIGVLVAAILRLLARLTQLKLGIPSRLVTGTLVATMIAWVTAWWLTKPGDFFPTPWSSGFSLDSFLRSSDWGHLRSNGWKSARQCKEL